jgi:hypothetical protein
LAQILIWMYKVPLSILRCPPNIKFWRGWQFWYPWVCSLIPMGRFFDTIELLLNIDSTMHSLINTQIQHWWIMMISRARVQCSATNIWVLDKWFVLNCEKTKWKIYYCVRYFHTFRWHRKSSRDADPLPMTHYSVLVRHIFPGDCSNRNKNKVCWRRTSKWCLYCHHNSRMMMKADKSQVQSTLDKCYTYKLKR